MPDGDVQACARSLPRQRCAVARVRIAAEFFDIVGNHDTLSRWQRGFAIVLLGRGKTLREDTREDSVTLRVEDFESRSQPELLHYPSEHF